MPSDPRSDALQALAKFPVANTSMRDTLGRVSEITTDAMPSAEMAGISLLNAVGEPTTAIFTDETAPDIDSGQYAAGRGPCLDAWLSQPGSRAVPVLWPSGREKETAHHGKAEEVLR